MVAAENISLFVRAVVHALSGTSRIELPEQVTGDDLLALQPTIARRSRVGEQLLHRLGHEPEAMRDELLTGLTHFVDEMGRELWQEREDDLRARPTPSTPNRDAGHRAR